jgi:pimeloyl-ACP methyl ester carboxylesterase
LLDGPRLRHGTLHLPEAEVHYLEAGRGSPLVLVHGLAASWRWWTPILDALTERHHVFAFDLPGHGRSRADRRLSLHSAGQVVCQLLSALGLERASLVGHSMGGRICMDVAASYPERVDRLVLVSTVGQPFGRSHLQVGLDLLREGLATAPDYQQIAREDAWRVDWLELALTTYEVLSDDFRDRLARIAAPTLLVWGERDLITPVEAGRELAQAIPNAHFAPLPEAGHNPMWDRPGDWSRLVLDFLADRRLPIEAARRAPIRAARRELVALGA